MGAKRRKEMNIGEIPRSLNEVLYGLGAYNAFLRSVLGSEPIGAYVDLKLEERRFLASYSHPMEICLYLGG